MKRAIAVILLTILIVSAVGSIVFFKSTNQPSQTMTNRTTIPTNVTANNSVIIISQTIPQIKEVTSS